MGVWIETGYIVGSIEVCLVTPFVGVWIETKIDYDYELSQKSHPSWVCGLKLDFAHIGIDRTLSHPSWVCGLKLLRARAFILSICHTLRGCVD